MVALSALVSGLDAELVRLGYKDSTMVWYRGCWRRLQKYFAARGVEEFSLDAAMAWVDDACGFFGKEQAGVLKPNDIYLFRVAQMLGEYAAHGAVLRRYNRSVSKLDGADAEAVARFQAHLRSAGRSASTVRTYGTLAGEFVAFASTRGGLACCDAATIGAFVATLAGYQGKTVEQKLCAVRSFLRFASGRRPGRRRVPGCGPGCLADGAADNPSATKEKRTKRGCHRPSQTSAGGPGLRWCSPAPAAGCPHTAGGPSARPPSRNRTPPATPSAACGPAGCPAPGCTPSPTPWPHRPRPHTSPPRRAPRPPPRRHRPATRTRRPSSCSSSSRPSPPRLHREPAGTSCLRGGAGKPNLIGVLEATVPSPHDRPQRRTKHRARSTKETTASQAAHRDHDPQRTRLPPGWPEPPARPAVPRAGHPGSSSVTLEPVTAPAGARAAHPPPTTPARDHPHRADAPRFAGTSRRQDQLTKQ
jgi:Phage integrase, N-terminal SAM-like domain